MNSVRVSDKGQVTLPAEFRRKLGIKSNSRMGIALQDNTIILKKATQTQIYLPFSHKW